MSEHCKDPPKPKRRQFEEWTPQGMETLKFNVDGFVRGQPGKVGIVGVLRDNRGMVVCMFSLFIGILDSNTAELLTIEKACSLRVSNPSLKGIFIEIVHDSKTAVSWINSYSFGSLAHVSLVYDRVRERFRFSGG